MHSGCLVDPRTAVLGAGGEGGVDFLLADDGIARTTEPAVGEQIINILKSAAVAIDFKVAVAASVKPPRDADLGRIHVQSAVLVVKNQGDFGNVDRLALRASAEDDFLGIRGAQLAGVRLAQAP